MNKDIFIKSSKAPVTTHQDVESDICDTVNFPKIMESIPEGYYKEVQPDLAANYTEWRWRFLQIGTRSFVEISKSEKEGIRRYVNKRGDWIENNVPIEYDQYVIRQYYCYSSATDHLRQNSPSIVS